MESNTQPTYRLRTLEAKDAPRMLEWMRDENATQYLRIGGRNVAQSDVESFIAHANDAGDTVHRAVVDSSDTYLGTISLKNISKRRDDAEYAIAMHPDAWGTGAARAATEQILSYAFDTLGLDRVYLNVRVENARANRFYEKVGFRYVETTELSAECERTTLNWYEIKRNGDYVLPKDTKIVLYTAIKVPFGGGRTVYLDYAKYLACELGYETYYIAPVCGAIESAYALEKPETLHIMNEDSVDFKSLEGAVFFTAINHLSFLLSKIEALKNARILLYFGHPQILQWYKNQFFAARFEEKPFLNMLWETNSACFQDASNLVPINRLFERDFLPEYVSTIVHQPQIDVASVQRQMRKDVIRILWLGRLDTDKIYSLINCFDNILTSGFDQVVEFHIVGDGNARNRINIQKYAPKIRFVFTSFLYGEMRDRYILENADFVMSMGISAMDCAMMGIPTVIPIVSPTPFGRNQYVFMQDVPDYSVGWNEEDVETLGLRTYSIKEVIDAVCESEEGRKALGEAGRRACKVMFAEQKIGDLLLHALTNTRLTPQDCLALPSIRRQMRFYHAYCKLRHRNSFDRYQTFTGWFKSSSNSGGGKLSVIPRAVKRIVSARRRNKKSASANVAKLERLYRAYPAKVEAVREQVRRTGKIKVAFLNLFNGVFPFQAVFEKMLTDEAFDPWIIVIPNISRTQEYQREKYFEAYSGLSATYGNRVLHGFDWSKGSMLELGDSYQIVCFSNPYDSLVHAFHRSTYFLNQNVLTVYANYGFPALRFWTEVIHSDFYNHMWKVCIETESNLQYLKEQEAIKGKNGYVTGYMKMDSLANHVPAVKERKKILICPHHTVWGWETLNISNFLQYADLFIELPKRFPQIDFVFRPHPLLFDNLISHSIWTQEEINDYLGRLQQNPNIVYDKSSDYFQTFADSDAMIHDCGSFIAEYLYTEKPCCYMMRSPEQTKATLLPLGVQCIEQYYPALNAQDIIDFIQHVVIEGNDPMKAKREAFSREVLKQYYPNAADRLIRLLKEELIPKDGTNEQKPNPGKAN